MGKGKNVSINSKKGSVPQDAPPFYISLKNNTF